MFLKESRQRITYWIFRVIPENGTRISMVEHQELPPEVY
jgi:hypothetical protein